MGIRIHLEDTIHTYLVRYCFICELLVDSRAGADQSYCVWL